MKLSQFLLKCRCLKASSITPGVNKKLVRNLFQQVVRVQSVTVSSFYYSLSILSFLSIKKNSYLMVIFKEISFV